MFGESRFIASARNAALGVDPSYSEEAGMILGSFKVGGS